MTEIRAVDVRDETALHEWWATGHDAAADRAYDVYPAWAYSRVALAEDNPERELTLLGAYEGTTMVGIAVAHGYEVANTEGFKILDLRDHSDWEPLEQRAAERRDGANELALGQRLTARPSEWPRPPTPDGWPARDVDVGVAQTLT